VQINALQNYKVLVWPCLEDWWMVSCCSCSEQHSVMMMMIALLW